jgi:hypothetical protein
VKHASPKSKRRFIQALDVPCLVIDLSRIDWVDSPEVLREIVIESVDHKYWLHHPTLEHARAKQTLDHAAELATLRAEIDKTAAHLQWISHEKHVAQVLARVEPEIRRGYRRPHRIFDRRVHYADAADDLWTRFDTLRKAIGTAYEALLVLHQERRALEPETPPISTALRDLADVWS